MDNFLSNNRLAIALVALPAVLLAMVALPRAASPQTGLATRVGKVATVRANDLLPNTAQGKKDLAVIDTRFAPKELELNKLRSDIQAIEKQMEDLSRKPGFSANSPAIAKLRESYETKQGLLQRQSKDAQSEYAQAIQAVTDPFTKKMQVVIDRYAKANGYTVVLGLDSNNGTVIWADDSVDITTALVSAYNAETPATRP